MVMRSLGYGHKVGVVQFIKGVQLSGEELFLREKHPEVEFYQMGTGFTWDTQDRSGDIAAAERTWAVAERMLRDPSLRLVVLDELTYMLAYKYLDDQRVLDAIRHRPPEQSVVVTGRGGGKALRELADTVSEIHDVKHAYRRASKRAREWTGETAGRRPVAAGVYNVVCNGSGTGAGTAGRGRAATHRLHQPVHRPGAVAAGGSRPHRHGLAPGRRPRLFLPVARGPGHPGQQRAGRAGDPARPRPDSRQ